MQNIFGFFATVLIPLLWVIAMVWPNIFSFVKQPNKRLFLSLYAVILFVVFFIPFVAMLPKPAPPTLTAKTGETTEGRKSGADVVEEHIRNYSGRITRVAVIDIGEELKRLLIGVNAVDGWSAATMFTSSAMNITEILSRVSKDYPGVFEDVAFNIYVDVVDRYNNPSKQDAILIGFDMPEVEKINFENLNYVRFLNNFVNAAGSSNAGKELLRPWCSENPSAIRFCGMALE